MAHLRDYIDLIRPGAAGAAAMEVPIGAYLARGDHAAMSSQIFVAAASTFMAVGAANVVNDVCDMDSDVLVRPNRPLAARRVTVRSARAEVAILSIGGMLLTGLAPGRMLVIAAVLGLGFAYSYHLKSTVLVGNILVATLLASPLLYGAYISGRLSLVVILGSGLTCTFLVSFELLKTIRDATADNAVGCVTVVTRYGKRVTVFIYRIVISLFTILFALSVLYMDVGVWCIVLILGGVVAPSFCVACFLRLADSEGAVRMAVVVMTVSWIPGLIALGAMR